MLNNKYLLRIKKGACVPLLDIILIVPDYNKVGPSTKVNSGSGPALVT